MPRVCTVCTHPSRPAIDAALAGGATMRDLAAIYRVSPDAMERHNAAHLPARLAQAQEAQEVAQADDLLAQVRSLQTRTLTLLWRLSDPSHAHQRSEHLRTAIPAHRPLLARTELAKVVLARMWGTRPALLSCCLTRPAPAAKPPQHVHQL
jgi:hypothetical protein